MRIAALVTFAVISNLTLAAEPTPSAVEAKVNEANTELWRRFVSPHGTIQDFVGELPTPEDCRLGKPNVIGWWSPIENGPMFTGLYLPAACERAKRSGSTVDRDKARRLADGLLKCASVSDVPGFVARGMGSDGRCHYPLGSDDQTHPWFYGLYAFLKSGLAEADQRERVEAKIREVGEALHKNQWRCPCDGAFRRETRGAYTGDWFRDAVRYLHLLRIMHAVTGESVWLERYRAVATERPKDATQTRLEICALGYPADREAIKNIDQSQLWIYVGCQGALRDLVSMETNPAWRKQFATGLAINAREARPGLEAFTGFDNNDTKVFGHARWREVYSTWFPQATQADAARLATQGDKSKMGQRKSYESRFMRNVLAGAAIAALAGEPSQRELIGRAIAHYDYTKLNMAEFFFAECAYYAVPPMVAK